MANVSVILNQTLLGESIINRLSFQTPDASSTTYQELADLLHQDYNGITNRLTTEWSLDSATMRNYDGGGAFSVEVQFTLGALTGQSNGDPLFTTSPMVVSLSVNAPKPNRGRIKMSGFTEDQSTDGLYNQATRDAIQAMVEGWRDGIALTAGSAFLRIARYDDPANVWTLNNPVESVIPRAVPGSQRSRKIGT